MITTTLKGAGKVKPCCQLPLDQCDDGITSDGMSPK